MRLSDIEKLEATCQKQLKLCLNEEPTISLPMSKVLRLCQWTKLALGAMEPLLLEVQKCDSVNTQDDSILLTANANLAAKGVKHLTVGDLRRLASVYREVDQ